MPFAVGKEAERISPLKTSPCGDKISIPKLFIFSRFH
jgi:hypothetical protein